MSEDQATTAAEFTKKLDKLFTKLSSMCVFLEHINGKLDHPYDYIFLNMSLQDSVKEIIQEFFDLDSNRFEKIVENYKERKSSELDKYLVEMKKTFTEKRKIFEESEKK